MGFWPSFLFFRIPRSHEIQLRRVFLFSTAHEPINRQKAAKPFTRKITQIFNCHDFLYCDPCLASLEEHQKSPPSYFSSKESTKKLCTIRLLYTKMVGWWGCTWGSIPKCLLMSINLCIFLPNRLIPRGKQLTVYRAVGRRLQNTTNGILGHYCTKRKKNLNCKTRALFLPVLFKLMRSHEWRLFNINKKAIKIT